MTLADKRNRLIIQLILLLFALAFLYPFFLVIINTFKAYAEIVTDVVSFPKQLVFSNYTQVWNSMNYPKLFANTFVLTLASVVGIVLFGSMAGYKLSRTKTKTSAFLFFLAIAPMMLPFQSFMVTLTKLAKDLHLINHLSGLTMIYWGLGCPMAVFLIHGFVKSIPMELEECAYLDGCSPYRLFFSIILPVMMPVISTVIILNVMWIWNDFLLPLIMLNGQEATLQLAAYKFFGQYKSEWNLALTAVVLVTLPPIMFFLFMQRYIIEGMVSGAVKG
ncbi:carbohydrate ABC transporter permease [Paenibacillus aestuarii]|uniref:Carbohydrate ABC transporter permease n=1 Tax=Paenibacillus aestuarii TaxID=516965 RepID=A0ABW0K5U6_9BACL|nr:carbohydrate ABC transporter permease [Paenibacillus aestuarii]